MTVHLTMFTSDNIYCWWWNIWRRYISDNVVSDVCCSQWSGYFWQHKRNSQAVSWFQ